MTRARILVIGSTNTDMVVEMTGLPRPGETVLGGAFRLTPGGKGANQAVAAARAGGQVTFITAVGTDRFGAESVARFTEEGIDTRFIATHSAAPSGVALILVDAQGENMIAVAPGANSLLDPGDLPEEAFADVALLLMQLEIPLDTVCAAARRAKAAGTLVLLNPAPMPLDGLPAALLAHVDYLIPNAGELRTLAPDATSMKDAARLLLQRGPTALIVTRGKEGVEVFTRDAHFHVPAIPVHAIDTVGAGDCFSATLGVALTEGQALPDAVRFAVAAAGLSTTRLGAQASMPTRAEIAQVLDAED